MRTWYAGVFAGGHQGSVAEEETGRTVALTYDPADAPLIAQAPAMLEALRALLTAPKCMDTGIGEMPSDELREAEANARNIIRELENLK
jgi:hypothetical protein